MVKLVITNMTLICSDYLLFLVIQQLTGSESRSRHVDSPTDGALLSQFSVKVLQRSSGKLASG